jgi:hypothetical protein
MSPELTQKLYDDFPLLFAERTLPYTETQMCSGFMCGDGWFDLIHRLSSEITAIIAADPSLKPEDFTASCVKEKYGGLRFYMSRQTEEMSRCIMAAGEESTTICERCGGLGKLRTKGWMYTLCDECHEEAHQYLPGTLRA